MATVYRSRHIKQKAAGIIVGFSLNGGTQVKAFGISSDKNENRVRLFVFSDSLRTATFGSGGLRYGTGSGKNGFGARTEIGYYYIAAAPVGTTPPGIAPVGAEAP